MKQDRSSTPNDSGRIKPGDLVMVVRGHVCDLGNVFTVAAIHPASNFGGWYCRTCGFDDSKATELFAEAVGRPVWGALVPWLKKIDPPAIDETTETEETVHA